MTTPHIVILGAGAAGTAAARTLSTLADLRVTLVTDSGDAPYTRMLIKGVAFGPTPPEMIRLGLPDVDVLADRADSVIPADKTVVLSSGTRLHYDKLIIATGSVARELPALATAVAASSSPSRVGYLHSLQDALSIREVLNAPSHAVKRVAVYGGGVTASETASMLRAAGSEVILIARSEIPGATAFGTPVAERLAAAHRNNVDTRLGHTIDAVEESPTGVTITLDDGELLSTDMLIIAVGTQPCAPLPWQHGVQVDSRLHAEQEDVFAAGGVAIHDDADLGVWRIDHWDDASAQGVHAAQAALYEITGDYDPGEYRPRSSHMAMVYGQMILCTGMVDQGEHLVDDGEEFVVYHRDHGTVVGVSGIDAVATVYQWSDQLHNQKI